MKNSGSDSRVIREEIEQMRLNDPKNIKSKNREIDFWKKLRLIMDSIIKKVS